VTDAGAAFGAAEARDGGACQTDQTETATRTGESYLSPFIAGKAAGHGQSNKSPQFKLQCL